MTEQVFILSLSLSLSTFLMSYVVIHAFMDQKVDRDFGIYCILYYKGSSKLGSLRISLCHDIDVFLVFYIFSLARLARKYVPNILPHFLIDPWDELVLHDGAITLPIFAVFDGASFEITPTSVDQDGDEEDRVEIRYW